MTPQEAIERLKGRHMTMSMGFARKDGMLECKAQNEAINMAVAALEKQIPKKPEYSSDGYAPDGTEVWDAHCPNCEHELDIEDICPNCGQAIDWS